MQLPFLKKTKAAPQREYFFALEITPSSVKSAVWAVVNETPQVLTVGMVGDWDGVDNASLIAAIDQTVSDAASKLDPAGKTEIEKVILGLPPTWVSEDKILPEKLLVLKEVSEKLALKPMGFVVTAEALTKYLQKMEGVPPTAILVGVWRHELEVSLARIGRLDAIQIVKKSDSVADDVVEGLSRFNNIDMLPSRMLLYDSGVDLEQVKQLLLTYPWQTPQKKLPFLHYPKVEILDRDFTVRAIALTGGSQMTKVVVPVETATATPAELGFASEELLPSPPVELEPEPEPEPTPAPTLRLPRFTWVGPVILVILGLIGLGSAYWYLPKSTVTLYLTPQLLQQEFDLPIVAQSMEVNVSDSQAAPATKSVVVGDKATGVVIIYNATDTTRKFASGTSLTASSGLKFILDEDVAVASASGSAVNLQLGKATAKIKAAVVGSDANLSAGSEFRVGNFATIDIVAKNETALSGGSSRQAKAISKEDITKLRTALSESLKTKAREQLLAKINATQTVIPESVTLQTVSEELSHKAEDVADEVNLELSVKAKGLVVEKADLDALIDQELKTQVPSGFNLVSKKSQSFTVKKTDKTGVTLTVSAVGILLPQVDQLEVARQIAGKYPDRAKDYLGSLPAIAQIDIVLSPHLPAAIGTLPRVPTNITVEVKALE